jgi:hypothetical protein
MVHLFLHLLVSASHKESSVYGIQINRGQLLTGRKALQNQTGISDQTLRTCIERLKSTNEITIQSTNKYSIITLCNYEDYQDSTNENNQQNNQLTNIPLTSNQPATNQQLTTFKNVLECKNKNYTADFLSFWDAYPKRIGKGAAWKAWGKIPSGTLPLILTALEWQRKQEQWVKEHGQFIPMPSTYLNQSRWEDQPVDKTTQSTGDNFFPTGCWRPPKNAKI